MKVAKIPTTELEKEIRLLMEHKQFIDYIKKTEVLAIIRKWIDRNYPLIR